MRVTHTHTHSRAYTLQMIHVAVAVFFNFAPVRYRRCRIADGGEEGSETEFNVCCLRGTNGITLVFHFDEQVRANSKWPQ